MKYIVIFLMGITMTSRAQTQGSSNEENKQAGQLNEEERFKVADVMPVFTHGDCIQSSNCFTNYIQDSLSVGKQECSGDIVVWFVVESDGTLSQIKFLRLPQGCELFREEVERLFHQAPPWIPGQIEGKAVPVAMALPIRTGLK